MNHILSSLRASRKRSRLSLSDIGFLLDVTDKSVISRYEHGKRTPHPSFLLLYHILFEVPVEGITEQNKRSMHQALAPKVFLLLDKLRDIQSQEPRVKARIMFLEGVMSRISSSSAYE